MTFFPNLRTILKIGNYSLYWYPVLLCLGGCLIYFLSRKEAIKKGYPKDMPDDLFIGCVICCVIGARLWYCAFYDLNYYLDNPLEILMTWDGGLAIQGAVIGGALFVYFYCRKHGYSFMRIFDIAFPHILLGQGIGRWGNFFNQEAFGQVTTREALSFLPDFILDNMYINGAYRQPCFLYEFLLNMVGYVLIVFVLKKTKYKRGDLAYAYMMWYGLDRTIIEHYRSDSLMIGNLKMAQVTAIFFMIVGILGTMGLFRKLSKKPVIIFDFDQTIAHTEPIILMTYEQMFEKYLPDHPFGEEEKKFVLGPTLKESFTHFNFPGNVDDLVKEYREINYALHNPKYLKEIPNATELLKTLKEKGYKIGVASNKMTETVWFGADVCGFKPYIDAVVGMDKVIDTKPNPECINKCIKELKGSFDSCVYVGDVPNDIKTAINAHVYPIGFNMNEDNLPALKEAGANSVTNNLLEILDILKEDHSWTKDMN